MVKRFFFITLCLHATLIILLMAGIAFAGAKMTEKQMEFLRKNNPEVAKQLEAFQASSQPSEAAKSTLKTALANTGVITVVDNASGTVLKTLHVNPAEAAARSKGGDLHIELLNPARLSVWLQNRVLDDLYKYDGQLPQTRKGASVTVGAQFTGTKFIGSCDVTIVSHSGNVFKFQLSNGNGSLIDDNNKSTPASMSGIIEATYVGQK